jgi:chorismate mutase
MTARESRLLALRGAITLDADTKDEVSEKTQRLVKEMLARNEVNHEDLVSIIAHGMRLCVRVLMHLYSDRRRDELHHVYLEGARNLRDDLPE